MWVPSMTAAKIDHATMGWPIARATRLCSRRTSASRPSRGSVRTATRTGAPATISGAATNTISRCWTMWIESWRSAAASNGGSSATTRTASPPPRNASRLARIDDLPRPALRARLADPAAQAERKDPGADEDEVEPEVEADQDVDDPERDAHGGEREIGDRTLGLVRGRLAPPPQRYHEREHRKQQRPAGEERGGKRVRGPHPQHGRRDPDQERVD